jgi:S-adenosylmethionine/arginine decarboxylase-like enzyme
VRDRLAFSVVRRLPSTPASSDIPANPRPHLMPAFSRLLADFSGVAPAQLRDPALLSGLMIAAAGAAGFSADGAPTVRILPHDAIVALLTIDEGCHMAVHAYPGRGLLLLDVLAPAALDARKALEVFARRVPATDVRSEQRARG